MSYTEPMKPAGIGICPHCGESVTLYAPGKKDPWRGNVCVNAVEICRTLAGVFTPPKRRKARRVKL